MQSLTLEELEKFAAVAYQHTGIRISANKRELMGNRLAKRARSLELQSYHEYYQYLIDHLQAELTDFISSVTTNETYFFRCPKHFYLLTKTVFPSLSDRQIRIWSAACSTGEEAYSLAIAALERLPHAQQEHLRLWASDIDYDVLKGASEGIYGSYALRLVQPDFLQRHFITLDNDRYQVSPQLRKLVRFGQHNLKHSFQQGKVDIIFCRNVLIYFDDASKAIVFNNLMSALNPGGYLFLGESEIVPSLPKTRRLASSVIQKL